jgi:biopolymer transport protein ExbD/biopolymer transport protein TolR
VRAKLGANASALIHLRGDREASYGEVVAVMDELARAGFVKIALITTMHGQAADPTTPAPAPLVP